MGVVQTELSRDMGPDLDRRAAEAFFQPSAQRSLLSLRHTGLTALPAIKGKRIPAILQIGFMPIFTSSLVEVFVNNVKELSVNGSFADGSFGFYNYSQAQVRYAGLQQDVLPPQPSAVPLPAALPALAAGIAFFGLMGWRRRQA
jgi:hypothetical protein